MSTDRAAPEARALPLPPPKEEVQRVGVGDLLSQRSRELLNRLAAFRKPVPTDAAEWVLGEKLDEETAAREFFRREREELVDDIAKLSEDEFVKKYKADLPDERRAEDIETPLAELIGWGLLTPIQEDGEVKPINL